MPATPDDTPFHHDLLAGEPTTFPFESFLVMRRSGLSVHSTLEALGFSVADLSFAQRALLEVDPGDDQALHTLRTAFGL